MPNGDGDVLDEPAGCCGLGIAVGCGAEVLVGRGVGEVVGCVVAVGAAAFAAPAVGVGAEVGAVEVAAGSRGVVPAAATPTVGVARLAEDVKEPIAIQMQHSVSNAAPPRDDPKPTRQLGLVHGQTSFRFC